MANGLSKYNRFGGINAVWLHEQQYKRRAEFNDDEQCSTSISITVGGRQINYSATDIDLEKRYEAAFNFVKSHSDSNKTDSEIALEVLRMLKY